MSVDLAWEFPHRDGLIYLNHAAVAPWPRRSAEAIASFARENLSCGAENYATWERHEQALREQLRRLINAGSTEEIALSKSTSEALSFIANGIDWRRGDNIVSCDEEFSSNRIVWQALAPRGVELIEVPLRSLEPEQRVHRLQRACDDRTRLLAISSVQYGSGLAVDLSALGSMCRDGDMLFCIDAIQSVGALQLDVQTCGADFVVADGHKWMLGPEGVALFYVRRERQDELALSEYGWHMTAAPLEFDAHAWQAAPDAQRFECGSPNTLGSYALSASLSLLLEYGMDRVEREVLARSARIAERLSLDPRLRVLTPLEPAPAAGIVSFVPVHADIRRVYQTLRRRGVWCAHRAGGIRFSPHFYLPMDRIDRALDILDAVLHDAGG